MVGESWSYQSTGRAFWTYVCFGYKLSTSASRYEKTSHVRESGYLRLCGGPEFPGNDFRLHTVATHLIDSREGWQYPCG